jgi:glycosyltransferase involved in cell wall biosynthesis
LTRILLLHQPVDGGVGRHVRDLFEGLSDLDHEVLLAGPAIPQATIAQPASVAPGLLADPRRAHRQVGLGRAIAPRADLRAVGAYVRLLDRERPELVHAHSSKAGAVARLGRLVRPRVPVVYTPHGFAFAGSFEREWERVLYREVERSLAPLASAVVAVCCAEARLAESLGRARRIRVVHNGIDSVPLRPSSGGARAPEHSPRAPVICTVARLQPGKGIDVLIDAMVPVKAQYPMAKLVVVGTGPMAAPLVERARALGLTENVEFLGEISDPGRVLDQADAFILPSLAESFPYVVLEAMAAGLPIVASDVGGIPEAVVSGQSGLLVPAGDPAALGAAIIALLADPSLRTRLGLAARERVISSFDRGGMLSRLSRVYDEVLGAAG